MNLVIWTGHSRSPGGIADIRCYKPAPITLKGINMNAKVFLSALLLISASAVAQQAAPQSLRIRRE